VNRLISVGRLWVSAKCQAADNWLWQWPYDYDRDSSALNVDCEWVCNDMFDLGSSIKNVPPPPCPLLSAFGHTTSPSVRASCMDDPFQRSQSTLCWRYLHCALAAAQCNVIGPVCLFVGGTTITRNLCIDPHQTGFVCESSDHLQLIKFWQSRAPGRGSAAGRKCLAPPYYSQRAVFSSLWALFS